MASVLVSVSNVYPDKVQCCLMRHEVMLNHPFCFAKNAPLQMDVDGDGSSTLIAISLQHARAKAGRLACFILMKLLPH